MLKKLVCAFAMLATLLAVGACAMAPTAAPSLYQRLGGHDAITAVVDDAIANIATDPRINPRFSSAAISPLKSKLVALLCARTGGPCTYTGLDMSSAHEDMNIRDDEFDALVDDLVKSLNKFKVPAREQRELLVILGQMRNAIVGH
jgi:hemoglobin